MAKFNLDNDEEGPDMKEGPDTEQGSDGQEDDIDWGDWDDVDDDEDASAGDVSEDTQDDYEEEEWDVEDDETGEDDFSPQPAPTPNRDAVKNRLRNKYPDLDPEDDELMFDRIGKDYDDYEQRLGHHEAQAKTLTDMFANDPRSASFLMDMSRGKSPFASYIRQFGPELKDMLDDPGVADEIARAEADYLQRKLENDTLEREYERNIASTREMLLQYQNERGLTDEQLEEAMAALVGMVRDGIMGKFSREALDMMLAAINHDSDVASAQAQGRLEGRNEKIGEQLRRRSEGDGLGSLGGTPAQPSMQNGSIFDIAAGAK